MLKNVTIRATLLALSSTLSIAAYAFADAPKHVDIPAGDLSKALLQLSKQYGADLLYRPEQVHGLKTHGAHGELTTEQAATRLLEGTPLELRTEPSGAILIAPPRANTLSETGETTPEETSNPPQGEEQGVRDSKGGSPDLFRRAQVDQGKDSDSTTVSKDSQSSEKTSKKQKHDELDEVVVTGTYIRNADPLSPVTTITREDIVEGGQGSLDLVLEMLPQDFKGGASQEVNTTTDNGHGKVNYNTSFGSGVNLRGLGTAATLVLLNGNRLAPTADGIVTDISFVPLSIIDRIDVLTDGASSIYGSDAIAGVVNIITRKHFDGFETNMRVGSVTEGNKIDYDVSQLAGFNWNSGNIVVDYDHRKAERLLASDRSFASTAPEPLSLIPGQDASNTYLSLTQDLGTQLTLRGEGTYSAREFSDISNYPNFGGIAPTRGEASNLSLNAGVEGRLGDNWRVSVNGTLGHEHDHTFFFNTNAPDSTFNSYELAYNTKGIDSRIDGTLHDLPGGALRTAVGVSVHSETIDSVESSSTWLSSRNIRAAYGELLVPLIGADNATPLARQVDISLSGRYDNYSDFGNAFTSKVGLRWIPMPGLDIHVTRSTSFRAPPLYFLNQHAFSFGYYIDVPDPLSSTGQTRSFVLDGDNPALKPERARNWNAGVTFRPESIPNLTLSTNYFNVDYSSQIVRLITGLSSVLVNEGVYQAFITRNPTAAQIAQALATPSQGILNYVGGFCFVGSPGCTIDPASIKVLANLGYQNTASTTIDGVDLNASFSTPMRIGELKVSTAASYFLHNHERLSAGAAVLNLRNEIYNPAAFRGNTQIRWSKVAWSSYARLNYVGAYNDSFNPECLSPLPQCHVASWITVDVGIAYMPRARSGPLKGMRVSLDVTDALDRNPPFAHDQNLQTGYDSTNASALNRFVALQLTKAW